MASAIYATVRKVKNVKAPSQRNRASLTLETLEGRDLMSVTSATVSFGTLNVVADDAADNVEIRRVVPVLDKTFGAAKAKRIVILPQAQIVVTDKSVTPNATYSFRSSEVQRINVQLQGGADRLESLVTLPTTVYAGAGNDTILTGGGADFILAGQGNDFVKAGAGIDTIYGEDDNDTLFGGPDTDVIVGGPGFNTLRGEAGDDNITSGGRSDIVDGGDGYDHVQLIAKDVNPTQNAEDITIDVPHDQPQDDSWSCGPNSGSRLLRAYGINVTYDGMRSQAEENSLVSKFHLGTLPVDLRYMISHARPLTTLETESSQSRVLNLLRSGKPVIALVATDKVSITALGVTIGHYGLMHYVVLNGFDQASQTIRYVDTDGVSKTWTYSEFDYHWRWFDHFTGTGEVLQAGLYTLGLRKRTLIV